MHSRKLPRLLGSRPSIGACVAALLASLLVALPTALAQGAPSGFSLQTLPFAGLNEPTGVEFAADGKVFVAERRGVIKVFDNLDVDVSWLAATDNVGVVGYDVQRVIGTETRVSAIAAPTVTLRDTGLAAGDYMYAIRSKDAAGNTSAWSPFVSAKVVVDASPPEVRLTGPAAGTVSGTVALAATATDDVQVAGVQFRVDGAAVGAEVTSAPYAIQWNSSTVGNGNRTITAVARDSAGKTTTSAPVVVNVANTGVAGLVGGWSFDEGSGTVAGDSSGLGNPGALGVEPPGPQQASTAER